MRRQDRHSGQLSPPFIQLGQSVLGIVVSRHDQYLDTLPPDEPDLELLHVTHVAKDMREQGGVEPDQFAGPWILDQWTSVLLQTTAFINFAQTYVDRHKPISEQFRADDQMLREFRLYLQNSAMVIPDPDWQRGLEFIRMSIQAEVINLVFGLRKGEEASLRADPQVRAAAEALTRAQQLLTAPALR